MESIDQAIGDLNDLQLVARNTDERHDSTDVCFCAVDSDDTFTKIARTRKDLAQRWWGDDLCLMLHARLMASSAICTVNARFFSGP